MDSAEITDWKTYFSLVAQAEARQMSLSQYLEFRNEQLVMARERGLTREVES